MHEVSNQDKIWHGRMQSVIGLATCGIACMDHEIDDAKQFEIRCDDQKLGTSKAFRIRGIGLDVTESGCFICGAGNLQPHSNRYRYLPNISAFVDSKEDGETIVSWFKRGAYLEFRSSEPDWLQVKIGACKQHKDNLEKLSEACEYYGVIREVDVINAMAPIAKEGV